ncbi:helix-turn-helix transcriptional regulator [Paenarthrobacter sp. GOM3]|jgi:PadR family transcriptional regulator PadR|uniref:PadR family transcriptional regulator n=1 Tax=Paenarthrobacter sp. GOM3 TaxID=2782567 RepID=UPI001BAB6F72|nr:helix-turn-helix transcriptional regulator [Paenarthrobacter sp. GOM3]WOH19280.1 helix-turn-helix transcriptional regulator [Paenarthrobacter sp. GOM3]
MESLGRVTPATALVLGALLSAESVWGLQIVKDTGKKPGTVYPILERLEAAGWVQGEWETAEDRKGPRRRYYRLLAEARPLAQEFVRAQRSKAAAHPSPAFSDGSWRAT